MKKIELKEKRGYKEKHFLQDDGTFLVEMYHKNIHYWKNGELEEINNTLVDSKKGYYYNKANDFQARFYKRNKGKILRLEKDKYFIEFELPNSNPKKIVREKKKEISKLIDHITYQDILDRVDINYDLISSRMKETIVIKEKKENLDHIDFVIKTNLNLEIEEEKILAKDQGEKILKIEKPYIIDANAVLNNNIHYQLKKEKDHYQVRIKLDLDWLNSEETKYPVYLDPTIECDVDTTIKDTYIYPNDTSDKGGYPYLKAGVERTNQVDRVNRALMKFELPILGTSSEIVNAQLRLIGYPMVANVENDIKHVEVHRVTSPWTEDNATWATMHDQYDNRVEAIYGAERSYVIDSVLHPNAGYGYCTITSLVKKWYEETDNYGILLKSANEEYMGDNFPMFYSSDNSLSDDINPKLLITYRNNNGIEPYFHYHEHRNSLGTMYVNTYNGNLVGTFGLGRTIGGVLKANIGLVYNTNDVVLDKITSFGKGFGINLEEIVEEKSEELLEYLDGDKTIHYFYKKAEEPHYVDEDGLHMSLKKENDNYVLKDKKNNRKYFVKNGTRYYLSMIRDSSQNQITIQRDGQNRIIKVTDNSGNKIQLFYQDNNIQIASPDVTTTLTLTNQQVTKIETLMGELLLSYNNHGLISEITDVNGLKYQYIYYEKSPYKIKKVKQYGLNLEEGESLNFEYGLNATKVVDHKGRVYHLLFNANGNLSSTNSFEEEDNLREVYSISQEYGEETTINKLVKRMTPIRYVNNFLKNTSFESTKKYFTSSSGMESTITNQISHTGSRSLKLSSMGLNQYIEQELTVPKGKFYTFSGYFLNEGELFLTLIYTKENGEEIEQLQLISPNTTFQRESVTIYYEENASSNLKIRIGAQASSINFVDDIQLEEGEVANCYNLLENSDFSSGLSDWELSSHKYSNNQVVATDSIFEVVTIDNKDQKALKLQMKPDILSSYKKRIPINGKSGDKYHISFWYKNEGTEHIVHDDTFFFGGTEVSLYFMPNDHELEHCVHSSPALVSNKNMWQYFSYEFAAVEDYREIIIAFHEGSDANDFYLTNLYLYKDLAKVDIEYDEFGNPIKIKDSENRENIFQYDNQNELIKTISATGKNIAYEYDNEKKDRIISILSSSGIKHKIDYDAFGNIIRTQISKGHPENIINGFYQIRMKGTNHYWREANHQLSIRSDSCSNTIWKLEKENNLYKIKNSLTGEYITYSDQTLRLSSQNQNNLFEFIPNNNGSFHIKKEEQEQYIKVNNDSLELSSLTLNDDHFQFYIEPTKDFFIENNATYTEDGRFLNSITDSNFNKTEYQIDPIKGLINAEIDPNGNITNYTYNTKNQISTIQLGDKIIHYSYNKHNLLDKIKQEGREYYFDYNNFLGLKKVRIGNNITLIENYYEEKNGNLIKSVYGNNQEIIFDYDKFDQIKTKQTANEKYTYQYDNLGNVAKVLSNNHITNYIYDNLKRLHEYRKDNFKIKYDYDTNDNVTKKTFLLNNLYKEVTNTYDSNDRLMKTNHNENEIDYTYDNLNRIKERKINDQYITTYDYISYGKRTSNLMKEIKNGPDKYQYHYDNRNNITNIYYNGNLIQKYYYDPYNQLIKEEDIVNHQIIEYIYDIFGNILSKVKKDSITNETIDSDTYLYENNNWKDQLTKWNGMNITYDEIGNPQTIGENITLSWINGRQLNSYSDTLKNLSITYQYDQNGIRTSKIVNGVEIKYYLEGTDIIFEKRGNNQIYYLYDSTGLLGLVYNNNIYYYIKNLQNDIIGILNSNYEKVVDYTYDSWGKIISIKGSNKEEITDPTNIGIINPFRYRSYYYDTETETYYLNTRYYHPAQKRFINADGIMGANQDILGYNLYAYCSNNPVSSTDFIGNFLLKTIVKLVIEKAKNVFNKMVDYAKNNAPNGTTRPYEYSLGKVYIIPNSERYTYMKKMKENDVLIIDKRADVIDGVPNPNMQIIDSYKIGLSEHQNRIIDIMYEYNDAYPSKHMWKRSRKVMLREWDMHTAAYTLGIEPISSQHVDLDNNGENSLFYNNVVYDVFDFLFGWAF